LVYFFIVNVVCAHLFVMQLRHILLVAIYAWALLAHPYNV